MRTKAPSLSTDGKSAGFSVAERQAIMEVMEISPRTQALMLLLSAAVGAAAGLVFDLITVFYRSTGGGGTPRYYEKALSLIGVVGRTGRVHRAVMSVLLGAADVLFPVAWVIAEMCVFYAVDDGIFRLSGLLAGFSGFYIWRKTVGVPFRACGSFIVYVLRAAVSYICFPVVFAVRMTACGFGRAASAISRTVAERRIARYDVRARAGLLQLAGEGFAASDELAVNRSKAPQNNILQNKIVNKEKEVGKNERKRKILREGDAR